MAKKKEKVKEEYKFVKISEHSGGYETFEIPEGATHVESEVDYDGCYYESDTPSVKITFYRKEKT